MTESDSRLIELLFNQLTQLPSDEQRTFLDNSDAPSHVIEEVRQLLIAEKDLPPHNTIATVQSTLKRLHYDILDTDLGRYRITRPLGSGGMGEVFLAERSDGEYDKQVVIKTLRLDRIDDHSLRQFKKERLILAQLEHPNIARLLDGGRTPNGYPYVVMEYITGLPLGDYIAENNLGIRERLKLFTQLCRAVEYAHQNLVLHGDIKPSNVLVTESGELKLLDFGVASLIRESELPDGDRAPPVRALTPAYASPEQLQGQYLTTASDVCSLGSVLYELLAGEPPPAYTDSAANGTDAESLEYPTESGTMKPLTSDLRLILSKARHSNPDQRYASAQQLKDEIDRYLKNLPVQAHPPSWAYVTGKFIRRHAAAVAATAVAALLIISASASALYQRQVAIDERDTAEHIQQFLVELFEISDPSEARGNSITAREVLDLGVDQISSFDQQPKVKSRLMVVMGKVYRSLGLYGRSQDLLEQGLASRQQLFGSDSLETAESQHELASLLQEQGEYAAAAPLFQQAIATWRKLLGDEHPDLAASLNNLATLYHAQGDYAEAEPLFRQSLAMHRSLLGEGDPIVAIILNNLASLLHDQGKYTLAEKEYRYALDQLQKSHGNEHPNVASALNNLGLLLHDSGEYSEAEPLFRQALAMRRKLLGEEHPNVAGSINNLAVLLQSKGDYAEAALLFADVLAMDRKMLGEEHPYVAGSMNNLATVLRDQGNYEEAESLIRQALAMRRKLLGEDHVDVGRSLVGLASTLGLQGRYSDAAAELEQALDIFPKHLPQDHWRIAVANSILGSFMGELGRFEEGESLLLESHPMVRESKGEYSAYTKDALLRMIAFYQNWDKPEEAAKYQDLLSVAEAAGDQS